MNDLLPNAPRPSRRGRSPGIGRWLRRAVKLFLALVALVLVASLAYRFYGEKRLADAVAETDRLDPNWRWDELEAQRTAIPEGENSANIVTAAAGHLPEHWPNLPALDKFSAYPPNARLDDDWAGDFARELAGFPDALAEARRLADMPTGQFPAEKPSLRSPPLSPYDQPVRKVAALLWIDAAVRAQEDQPAAALESCRAIFNAGRSLGEGPTALTLLRRLAYQFMALGAVERTLAQCDRCPPEGLAAARSLLRRELAENPLLPALRGDRVFVQEAYEEAITGDIDEFQRRAGLTVQGPEVVRRFGRWLLRGWLRENQAVDLGQMTAAVEVAKLPLEKQIDKFSALEDGARRLRASSYPRYVMANLLTPALAKIGEAYHRSRAEMRCAEAALAAEEYRLANGRWPDRLDELVPKLLPAVPTDPFDGQPIRLKRLPDGVVVYSVGPDRTDDGGILDQGSRPRRGPDLGFRLWDVTHRRQPPPPPEPEAEPEP
jgi:hypothetical protein